MTAPTKDHTYLLRTLQKLISFKTVTGDTSENDKALDWIKKELKGLPLFFAYSEKKGFPALVITTRKTKNPKLWISAHLDVVPAADTLFRPKVAGDKLYGRGAWDMKHGIACAMTLLRELHREKLLHLLDLGIMITTDEEVGGEHGVRRLLDEGYGGDFCFLSDGGADWSLETAAKGIVRLHIDSAGKSAHGSRPWMGVNAIERLNAFLLKIKNLFPKEPCGDESHRHRTLTVGCIEGGTAVNQIPDSAHALLDIRYLPTEQPSALLAKLKRIQKKSPGILISVLMTGNSFRSNPADLRTKRFYQIAAEQAGIKLKTILSHGSSDGRFFAAHKIPTLITRPDGGGHHTAQEWVSIKSLETFYAVLKKWAQEIAAP